MAQKTSINIKPCNIGSSEPHNRRTAEYLTRINKEKFYIRTDLMPKNEAWVAPDFRNTSLTERYNQIAVMVKEKTGRAMQTKDRERVNKKTGKVTIVRGSTPLKEGVVVIKEDTTMEQLKHFCEVCKERWGITPLQVFIHRDEGHYSNPEDIATWKPNLHAHIVWDWMDHETGKSCKLDEKAMCEMQTVLAECLEMQRGISKKLTGKEHLERNDFIITKQKQEAEKVKAEKDAALAAKTKTLVEAKQSAEAERDKALAQSRSSIIERNEAVRQLQEQEADIQQRISQAILTATKKKDNTIRLLQGALEASQKILNVIADILYQASEVFKRAVDAIIHFGTEQYKSIFSPSEAADIKSVMQEYGETTEMQKAIGDWLCGYTEHRQPFDEIKHRHTLKEVGDVAEGAYDWKIERMQENGIKM